MGKIRIHVEVRADEVDDLIDGIRERITDVKPAFRWAHQQLKRTFADNFTSQGLEVGGWAPLSAEYASWKLARYPGAPTLVQSGRLFRSVSELSDPLVNRIDRLSATFGTGVPYAQFHQTGTSNMPKREIVFINQTFLNDLAEKMANYVVEGNEGLLA